MKRSPFSVGLSAIAFSSASAFAGPYLQPGIPSSDPRFAGWATNVIVERGPQNISASGGPLASFGGAADAVGSPADAPGVVSLGDGGSATATFAKALRNGSGPDFAVFENGFLAGTGEFAELAFVEVSSNGADFFRFPSISLTQSATQVATFGVIDPSDLYNLAGKDGIDGTGFDLAELAGLSPLLDVNGVTHVRLIDVVGSIDPLLARRDSQNRIVNDPFPTGFATSGFDLDAVGAINTVPEPATLGLFMLIAVANRRRK